MKNIPQTIPVFPLTGALLLPGGYLPLNIFEPRYINMVDDALATNRMIGMIQGRRDPADPAALYSMGCIGQITSFHETEDRRYLITLTGKWRFRADEEVASIRGYRCFRVSVPDFDGDEAGQVAVDWTALCCRLERYFAANGMDVELPVIDKGAHARFLSMLCMICPLDASEKQALLEAESCQKRYDLFSEIIDLALEAGKGKDMTCH